MTTDQRTPAEIEYDATALSTRTPPAAERSPLFYELKDWIDSHFTEEERSEVPAQPTLTFNAYITEVYRRLNDPTREPFVLARPLTAEETARAVAQFDQLDHADRWLEIFERIVDMPESEQNRTLDMLDTALEVLEEYDVEPPA
jgi:hypothetical protein